MKQKILYGVFFLFAFLMGMAASMGGEETFPPTPSVIQAAPELPLTRSLVPTPSGMTLVIRIPQPAGSR